jgi:hypothetical protein
LYWWSGPGGQIHDEQCRGCRKTWWAWSLLSCGSFSPSSVVEMMGSSVATTAALSQGRTDRPKTRHWWWSWVWRMDYPWHAQGDLGCDMMFLLLRGRQSGDNLAATCRMFNSDIRIVCTDLYDTPTISAMLLIILRWSACTSSWICSTFSRVLLVEGLPDRSSSSRDVLPPLKHLCHSKHRIRPIASSL